MISTSIINTPIGDMICGFHNGLLCLLEFADRPALKQEMEFLQKYYQANIKEQKLIEHSKVQKQIHEYFSGDRHIFNIEIDLCGTEFQKKIWKLLLKIPFGTTKSYEQQAIDSGNIKSIRAVAKANGENRISIIIPCHRVIGKNGKLIGYGGGLHRKQKLLEHEAQVKGNYRLEFI